MSLWHPKRVFPPPSGNPIVELLHKFKGLWFSNSSWPTNIVSNGIGGYGYINWYPDRVELNSGDSASSYSWVRKDAPSFATAYSWNRKRYLSVHITTGGSYLYTYTYYQVVSGNMQITLDFPNPLRHIGFKLIAGNLYGTVGNGTSESTLLLETWPANTPVSKKLECVLEPGVECRFYVDGVDKGALTTNLPSGTTDANIMFYAAVLTNHTYNKKLNIYEVRVFQEE